MKSTFKSLDAYKNVNYKDAINIYGGLVHMELLLR